MDGFRDILLDKILIIPAILVAFTVQGYGRALMADKLGDKGPRFQGRVTMNPLAHIDPIGFFMILLVGIGFTKPVDVNSSALKGGRKGALKVAIAPALANLIIGATFTILYVLFVYLLADKLSGTNAFRVGATMVNYIGIININLFIFNLIPIPGLAGFDILRYFSPKTFFKVADSLYRYQMLILLGIILIGYKIIGIPSGIIYNFFIMIGKILFGFLL